MSSQGRTPGESGGIHIGGGITGSNVQMGSGTVYGGMHVTAGATSTDAVNQALDALRELRSELECAGTNASDVEQARTVASIIERELGTREPNHTTLGTALAKLQNLVLSVGVIAGAVNKIAAALGAIGVR